MSAIQAVADYGPRLLSGFWLTFQLTLFAIILGSALAIPLALLRLSKNKIWSGISYAFTFYFRGTPLLVQLFLVYYGSGQFRTELSSLGLWVYFREAYFCALFTLTLNTGAYSSEIFRGAIAAVNKGLIEAARAYGMSGILLYRRIILPQACRIAWPSYGNEVIFLMQATSLVSTITILDLTGVARRIISETFAVYEVYIIVALIYLIITLAVSSLFNAIEQRYLRKG